MASKKTEATELSLAFGLLGFKNPQNVDVNQLNYLFENTLPIDKYQQFINSMTGVYRPICERMICAGIRVREKHQHIKHFKTLAWMGEQRVYIATS